VERNWQIAIEMDKINKEYREHNMIRDFGLTSWAHMSCSLGLIFLQRKLATWKLLIEPSVGGTTRMPHPSTGITKWTWSKGKHAIGIKLEQLLACLIGIFLVCRFCSFYRILFHKLLYELCGLYATKLGEES
jgi:hypothetical protein